MLLVLHIHIHATCKYLMYICMSNILLPVLYIFIYLTLLDFTHMFSKMEAVILFAHQKVRMIKITISSFSFCFPPSLPSSLLSSLVLLLPCAYFVCVFVLWSVWRLKAIALVFSTPAYRASFCFSWTVSRPLTCTVQLKVFVNQTVLLKQKAFLVIF